MWDLEPGEEADYSTRVIVRRPEAAEDFSGTVVVEWLNVSSGADVPADYTYLAQEILRQGHAWVGVSAQVIGVEGGPVAVEVPGAEERGLGKGLKAIDPERYGDLSTPATPSPTTSTPRWRAPSATRASSTRSTASTSRRILAVGESQSAYALTSYINGVQPLTRAFDGFLVHSRGGGTLPLGEPGAGVGMTDVIGGEAVTIRTDGEAPVMVVETEGDVIGLLDYLPARQPDEERFRLWEVAGTAHADAFQVGSNEATLGCATPINRGQQVFVLRAALRHLDTWAGGGDAPPEADRLEVDESGAEPTFVADEVGNTEGGVRTPVVDAPVDRLSGAAAPDSSIVCILMGSTTPLDDAQLAELYPTRDDYVAAYEAATDAAIEAGVALDDDRDEILAGAAARSRAGLTLPDPVPRSAAGNGVLASLE